jgi:hypothetical protein
MTCLPCRLGGHTRCNNFPSERCCCQPSVDTDRYPWYLPGTYCAGCGLTNSHLGGCDSTEQTEPPVRRIGGRTNRKAA